MSVEDIERSYFLLFSETRIVLSRIDIKLKFVSVYFQTWDKSWGSETSPVTDVSTESVLSFYLATHMKLCVCCLRHVTQECQWRCYGQEVGLCSLSSALWQVRRNTFVISNFVGSGCFCKNNKCDFNEIITGSIHLISVTDSCYYSNVTILDFRKLVC
jgi:hypothetical protein